MGSNILNMKFKSSSPTQAALIANTALSVFIDTAVEMKTTAAQQTARWFEPQTEKLQAEVKVAREKLSQFQRESKLMTAGTGDTENSQLVALANELAAAKGQLLLLQSQVNPTGKGRRGKKQRGPSGVIDDDCDESEFGEHQRRNRKTPSRSR